MKKYWSSFFLSKLTSVSDHPEDLNASTASYYPINLVQLDSLFHLPLLSGQISVLHWELKRFSTTWGCGMSSAKCRQKPMARRLKLLSLTTIHLYLAWKIIWLILNTRLKPTCKEKSSPRQTGELRSSLPKIWALAQKICLDNQIRPC